MDKLFEQAEYGRVLRKTGFRVRSSKSSTLRTLLAVAICWLPVALITLVAGTFWTGDITTSFITSIETQARLLVTLPIFILADRMVNSKLALIIGQFVRSGIVSKEVEPEFEQAIRSRVGFIRSNWTDLAILVLCYVHVLLAITYIDQETSLLPWQINKAGEDFSFTAAGYWSIFLSRPIVLFFFYRWLLRIIMWGVILHRISKMDLHLYPMHPDRLGGLGFIGEAIRYYAPVAFAISATVAGLMGDMVLHENVQLTELKGAFIGYLLFITLLFTLPLVSFSWKLINAREESVFESSNYANGLLRELKANSIKSFDEVTEDDLKLVDFSAVSDYSASVENALKMKSLPFELKDLIPLWITSASPFILVVFLSNPMDELVNKLFEMLV